MKVEIHSHTDIHSLCSRMHPQELIAMAEACGYDAVFVTDHGKVWTPRDLAGIREHCNSVQVFPGIEIAMEGGVDLLVLGADDPAYENLSSPSDVFARACADGYLTVIAHPFRWNDTLPDYCALADAIEVLTCNHPTPLQAEAAREYANTTRMAEVYASDAHGVNFMNRFWLEFPSSVHRQWVRRFSSGINSTMDRFSSQEIWNC